MNNYLGIDIGGTAVKMAAVDEMGHIIANTSAAVNFDDYETPIMDTVTDTAASFIESNQELMLKGIGVSATGIIDSSAGTVLWSHIRNYNGYDIRGILEKKLKMPVKAANDAYCAMLAESWIGSAHGISDALMVTVGTGIGGSVITNAKIFSGRSGMGAEIGFAWNYEEKASVTALISMIKTAVQNGSLEGSMFKGTIDGAGIFAALREHRDSSGVLPQLVDTWQRNIAEGIIGLIHIFGSEKVIIGGGIAENGDIFIEPLQRYVLEGVLPPFRKNLSVDKAMLGNDAGMIGAVRNVLLG